MTTPTFTHNIYLPTEDEITTFLLPYVDRKKHEAEIQKSEFRKKMFDETASRFVEKESVILPAETKAIAFEALSPQGVEELTKFLGSNKLAWRGGSIQVIHLYPGLLAAAAGCESIVKCPSLRLSHVWPPPSSPTFALESDVVFPETTLLDSASFGSLELIFGLNQFPSLRQLSITFDKKQKMASKIAEIPHLERIVAYRPTDVEFWNTISEKGPVEVYQVLGSACIAKSKPNTRLTKLGLCKVRGLEDIGFIEHFPNINELVIEDANKITDFQPLLKLAKLRLLQLRGVKNEAQAIALFAKHRPNVVIDYLKI